jgi:superfamily I DNA/RNA helicase
MNCNKRPILVGEPHGSWTLRNYNRDPNQYFDKTSFDINGELIPISNAQSYQFSWKKNKSGATNGHVTNLLKSKNYLVSLGYANQSDANYFAMRILEKYPLIRQAIVHRFPNIIIDEAQDTSEIQMRIIDLLVESDLNEIMLVGDPDQAIFEWNGARPALLSIKIEEWGNVIELNENWRSSQRICNFTYRIYSLLNASAALNKNVADWNFQPTVITYNNNLGDIVNTFLNVCEANEIEVSDQNISVLYRSKGMINEILGVQKIPFGINHWDNQNKFTKEFARGKFLYDNGDFKNGFKLIERALIKMRDDVAVCTEEMIEVYIKQFGFIKYRSIVYNFIKLLPNTNTTLGNWIDLANEAFALKKIKGTLEINPSSVGFTFSQVFLNEDNFVSENNYRIGTVHSAKGETFDATLLILKRIASNRGKYSNILANENPPSEHEELRIAYVGMTRPRKVLMLAVPDNESKVAWENKLNDNN